MKIDAILVPQGAEYQAICRGLKKIKRRVPPVFSIPVGVKPVALYLEKWLKDGYLDRASQPKVLLMGLCGSLSPRYSVGKVVLYENCIYQSDNNLVVKECDRILNNYISERLISDSLPVNLVKSWTSDRLIHSVSEKRYLAEISSAEVVDMEGFAANTVLTKAGITVAMLRAIGDGCDRDLPDISAAISADGSLKSLPLALGMLRQPIAAFRLIRGSLHGLQVLQQVTQLIF